MAFQEAHSKVPMPRDLTLAKEAGYIVRRKSDWHYHVTREGSQVIVNVWWTKKKIMQQGAYKADYYDDLVSDLAEYFDWEDLPELETQKEAKAEFADFRKDPLAYLKNKHGN